LAKALREDILRDFGARSASVDNTILEMNARASRFFETTIRLSRIPDLINTSRVKEEFARDVVGDRFHTQAEPPAHAVG
jgi:hypothetical protein